MASLEGVVKRLEAAVGALEAATGGSAASAGGSDLPVTVAAYDELFEADFNGFITACKALGGDYAKIGDIGERAFKNVRDVILAATKCKKPSDEALIAGVFAPSLKALQEAGALPDNRNKAFNHQSAFVEYLNCVQWVMISPAPKPFVQGCKDSSDFYVNKVLTTFKDDPAKEHHRNFAKFLRSSLDNLGEYIKRYHTTGLSWNASGVDIAAYDPAATFSAPTAVTATGGGSIEERLAAVAGKVEKLSLVVGKKGAGGEGKSDTDEPPSIADYDAIVNGPVKEFVTNAKKLGGDIAALGDISEQAFAKLRWFIVAATKCAKPSDDVLGAKFGDIAELLGKVKPDNRNKAFNHQSAYQEHINIVQWILVAPAPRPFAQSTVEAADFFLNKILTGAKDDPMKAEHRAFVKGIKDITSEMCDYIKKYHATGLTWKNGGANFAEYK